MKPKLYQVQRSLVIFNTLGLPRSCTWNDAGDLLVMLPVDGELPFFAVHEGQFESVIAHRGVCVLSPIAGIGWVTEETFKDPDWVREVE